MDAFQKNSRSRLVTKFGKVGLVGFLWPWQWPMVAMGGEVTQAVGKTATKQDLNKQGLLRQRH
jgi:hypothetical protein